MTPTPNDFLQLLETTLQLRRVAFSRAALQAFVSSAWPWIEDSPDPDNWADRFIESGAVLAPS